MFKTPKSLFLSTALLAAGLCAHSASHAVVTYHFAESSGAGNLGQGVYAGLFSPVTFDFTVGAALAANGSYDFGYAAVEPTLSATVQSFLVSGGNALSTLSSVGFPTVPTDNGFGMDATKVRIHVETNAAAVIQNYNISIIGKPAGDPGHVYEFSLNHSGVSAEPGFSIALFSTQTFGTVGSITCSVHPCMGSFTQVSAVPEPSGWLLMAVGTGAIGVFGSRRTARHRG